MVKEFIWKTKNGKIKIKSLEGLLDKLTNIKQEDIDKEINFNMEENKLSKWIENNFPNEMELIANLKQNKEFTPQQMRERLVRDLRKIT
jgi:biopolymer transport protein ExbB/TolQ